jgi:rSAM/selenodomain-associated transferase 2
MTLKYSVIIPTLNEERQLPACLDALRTGLPRAEVIVVDGGSRDRTLELANAHGARALLTAPCRGAQCRLGAEQAEGDVLCFLHADSRLAPDAEQRLDAFFADSAHLAGTLRVKYGEPELIYRVLEWGSQFDSVFTSFGDQGILVRRSLYQAAGGIPDLPLFEDVEFLKAVRKQATIYGIPVKLQISARRFAAAGVFRQLARNQSLMLLYLLGASPHDLARRYRVQRTDPMCSPAETSVAEG